MRALSSYRNTGKLLLPTACDDGDANFGYILVPSLTTHTEVPRRMEL